MKVGDSLHKERIRRDVVASVVLWESADGQRVAVSVDFRRRRVKLRVTGGGMNPSYFVWVEPGDLIEISRSISGYVAQLLDEGASPDLNVVLFVDRSSDVLRLKIEESGLSCAVFLGFQSHFYPSGIFAAVPASEVFDLAVDILACGLWLREEAI